MARLINLTRDTVLAERLVRATTFRARLIGLLGRKSLPEGEGLSIEPCSSVHMLFMRFAIDVVFVNADGRVVRAISGLRPWRATRLYPEARWVAELPNGTLARSGTAEGDSLQIDETRFLH